MITFSELPSIPNIIDNENKIEPIKRSDNHV